QSGFYFLAPEPLQCSDDTADDGARNNHHVSRKHVCELEVLLVTDFAHVLPYRGRRRTELGEVSDLNHQLALGLAALKNIATSADHLVHELEAGSAGPVGDVAREIPKVESHGGARLWIGKFEVIVGGVHLVVFPRSGVPKLEAPGVEPGSASLPMRRLRA